MSKGDTYIEVPAIIERRETVKINRSTIYWQLMHKAARMAGVEDDAGCDWYTDEAGNTYIGGPEWHVSSDPNVAALVDAAYVYAFGNASKLEAEGAADE